MSYSVLADFKTTEVKTDGSETYPLWGYEPEGAQSWEFLRMARSSPGRSATA